MLNHMPSRTLKVNMAGQVAETTLVCHSRPPERLFPRKEGSDSCHRFRRSGSMRLIGTRYLVWRTLSTYDA
jgi:hypothetical protein